MKDTRHTFESGTIDDCDFPATVAVRDYWKARAVVAGDTPKYSSVDLMDLYKVAPFLTIKDVIDGGQDFVIRYWGTELRRALGFEGTGMRISELQPEEMSRNLLVRYRRIYRSHVPESRRAQIEHLAERRFVSYEVLHVPWLDPAGRDVAQIMTVYQFNIPLNATFAN